MHYSSVEKPCKSLGQHFLSNQFIAEKIVNAIAPNSTDCMIEIGPGKGALTIEILSKINQLIAIEIDKNLAEKIQYISNLTLFVMDALLFDFSTYDNLRVVGNLPYNISTEILFYLKDFYNIINMTFMLQDEVVNRICAEPHNKKYGKTTVLLQAVFYCKKLFIIKQDQFIPQPKVLSALIQFERHNCFSLNKRDEIFLKKLVFMAFQQRRKNVYNSLKYFTDILIMNNIDKNARAENITVDMYIKLAKDAALVYESL